MTSEEKKTVREFKELLADLTGNGEWMSIKNAARVLGLASQGDTLEEAAEFVLEQGIQPHHCEE